MLKMTPQSQNRIQKPSGAATAATVSLQNSPRLMLNGSALESRQPFTDKKMNTSLDFAVDRDRFNISVNEIVKSNLRRTTGDSVFGISGYHIPNTNVVNSRPRTTKFTNYKFPHYIE